VTNWKLGVHILNPRRKPGIPLLYVPDNHMANVNVVLSKITDARPSKDAFLLLRHGTYQTPTRLMIHHQKRWHVMIQQDYPLPAVLSNTPTRTVNSVSYMTNSYFPFLPNPYVGARVTIPRWLCHHTICNLRYTLEPCMQQPLRRKSLSESLNINIHSSQIPSFFFTLLRATQNHPFLFHQVRDFDTFTSYFVDEHTIN
jgi:hypothetical protein